MARHDRAPSRSAWDPLRGPLFRVLWAAALASSMGSWVEGVTVMWRMAALTGSPLLVSLVQTAGSLAIVALAVPAGAISDLWPRKVVLALTQGWAVATMVVFAVAAALGVLGPVVILVLTFSLGLATTLGWPAWQMTLPEVALPTQMPAAVALNSAQWNIAQVLGPLLTGVVLAKAGASAALGLSALGFAGFFGAAVLWRPARVAPKGGLVQVHIAGRAALRYARRSRALRGVLARTVLFVLPGSAMLALLPLVARRRLHEGASGYGLLLSLLGAGALLAVALLPRLGLLGPKALLWLGMLLLAATLTVAGLSRSPWVVWPDLFVAGTAWLVVPTTLVVVVQRVTPVRARSRGLGTYLVTYQAALAAGSAVSGVVAGQFGIPTTFLSAAGALVLCAVVAARTGWAGVDDPAS
ncbi:MAG: MFS transporter [Actinobacteria bacterium]|nr:MFS transporter [Actinomycetota bacterium]